VHVSDLGVERRITHPREVVKPGDAVEAAVLSVDTAKRRIGLSLDIDRAPDAADPEARAHTADQAPGSSLGSFGELLRKTLDKKDRRG
jgi:small subunit ribosomal protein S1